MIVAALHGYPLDRRLWGPLARLAGEGALGPDVRFFAPDLRGRGTSRRPAAEVHTMSLLADDLADDLDDLVPKGEPLVLAGLSMGGYVLFELLRRHGARLRDRLAAVVLCDTKASADTEAGRLKRRESIEAIRKGGIEAALHAMLPVLLAPASRGTEAEATARAMILATPAATACADLAGMAVRDEGFEALSLLTVPLLLVVGEEDAVTPPSDAEAMAEVASRVPFVRLLTIPRAGHLSPLEKPRDVAEGIGALIRRVA